MPEITGLTDDELRATRVEVRWRVEQDYRSITTLLDVLEGLDINEEDWRNEDGSCRFGSAAEAIEWARNDGLRGDWATDWLSGMETERNLYDSDCDARDADIRPLPVAATKPGEVPRG